MAGGAQPGERGPGSACAAGLCISSPPAGKEKRVQRLLPALASPCPRRSDTDCGAELPGVATAWAVPLLPVHGAGSW